MESKSFFQEYKGRIIGIAIFFVFGILLVTVGFYKTCFIIFLSIVGYLSGRLLDDKELIKKFFNTYIGK